MIERLGSHYGGWWADLSKLNSNSVVYSVGVGEDVTFDVALIERVHCVVHAFDPTPKSLAWISKQALSPLFVMHPIGLSSSDELKNFYLPEKEEWVSHTLFPRDGDTRPPIVCEFRKLSTLMTVLKHSHIDLLKMDIEGAELEVFDDLVADSIVVHQLNVEVHGDVEGAVAYAQQQLMKRDLILLKREGPNLFFEVTHDT